MLENIIFARIFARIGMRCPFEIDNTLRFMDTKNQFYNTPVTEIVELRFENGLLQTSGLGVGGGKGSEIIEDRMDGGSWGNGDWY